MKDKIIKALAKVTDISEDKIHLEVPEREEFGDYSTNIAMQVGLRSTVNGSPREKAEQIITELKYAKTLTKYIDRIEVAGPGFINFYLSKAALFDVLVDIKVQKDLFGTNTTKKNKKVVIEYTDPNPFKEFHVGHLYSNTVGESIARLIEAQGANVWRADYFGDVGMHVAKAIWGLFKKFEEDSISIDSLKGRTLKARIEYLGQAYANGATEYEEGSESSKDEMKELNFLIFRAAQDVVLSQFREKAQVNYDQYIKEGKYKLEEIKEIYEVGRGWSMEYFESIYKRLGMKFAGYYPESRTGEFGYGMVMDGLSKGIFEKGEKGAIIFPGEKHGLHNRVFINSLGLPTYETKDFGNAVVKYKDFPYDESLIVTGNEINEYFVVVLKALGMYKKELADATTHLGHGMVRLPEGKMSSRTGKIVRGEWVLDETKKQAFEIINKNDSFKDSSLEEKENTAEMVAQGAIKYAFLKQGIGGNIAFDFETSLSFDGNSGPYIQYTYARTQSVLSKALGNSKLGNKLLVSSAYSLMPNNEELSLFRALNHFPEVVQNAAENLAPNLLCNYIYDLAQKFNGFYNKHSILTNTSQEVTDFRLILTESVGQVLKNGLNILGIQAPKKM